MPGAPFTWTKAGVELEIGFRDFEYLAAPFSPPRQVGDCRDDRICHQGEMPNSGGKRDSLISAESTLIARFNSLQGGKKFPVRMRRELARKKLISCAFRCLRGACKPGIGEIPGIIKQAAQAEYAIGPYHSGETIR